MNKDDSIKHAIFRYMKKRGQCHIVRGRAKFEYMLFRMSRHV